MDFPINVPSQLTVRAHKNQQDDQSENRNQANEYPPATATNIMQSANGDGKAGDQDSQAVETRQSQKTVKIQDYRVGQAQGNCDDLIDAGKYPELRPSSSTVKICIVLNIEVPMHRLSFIGNHKIRPKCF